MTCIVGLVDRGHDRVILGSDSACVSDDEIALLTDDKTWVHDDGVVIGAAGSLRGLQVIKYQLSWTVSPTGDLFAWMVNTFCEALGVAYEASGFESNEDLPMQMLVGVRDRLFFVGHDRCVVEPRSGFDAIGTGGPYALGAMTTALDLADQAAIEPLAAAAYGLAAAAEHVTNVVGPFNFVST